MRNRWTTGSGAGRGTDLNPSGISVRGSFECALSPGRSASFQEDPRIFELSEIVTDSATTYLLVLGLVTLDAVFPTAPSESLLVAGGVLISGGDLDPALLVLAGATGALLGHSILFGLGRWAGPSVRRRLFKGAEAERRLERGTELLRRRTWLIVAGDFVPWGRTVLMFAAGGLGLGVGRFYSYAAPGAAIWASFYVALGYIGGSTFEEDWQALAVSIAAALLLAGGAEVVSRIRERRSRSRAS